MVNSMKLLWGTNLLATVNNVSMRLKLLS